MSDQGGYGYQGNQNWQPAPYGQPDPYGRRPTNTLAVLALVFAFLIAPLGIVFGHIARGQIKRTGEEGDGLALAGLIIGYIFTALGILAVIVWIAFFGLLAAAFGNAANEASSRSLTYTTPYSYSTTTTRAPSAPTTSAENDDAPTRHNLDRTSADRLGHQPSGFHLRRPQLQLHQSCRRHRRHDRITKSSSAKPESGVTTTRVNG